MSSSPLDAAVDQLYQVPLDRFVTKRQELVRTLSRSDARVVRDLAKPNAVAWALNQLYWSARPVFDRLLEAASALRAAQADALAGKRADVRSAGGGHRGALEAAVRETVRILGASGHAVSSDALRALTSALEAVPWKERPGRLSRPPAVSGFGVFAGLPVSDTLPKPASEGSRTPVSDSGHTPPIRTRTMHGRKGRKEGQAATSAPQRRKEQLAREALEAARAEAAGAEAALTASRKRNERAEAEERAARDRLEAAAREAAAARESLEAIVREARTARDDLRAAERRDFAARSALKKAERRIP